MKIQRYKTKTQYQPSDRKCQQLSKVECLKVKFDLTKSNLSCFMKKITATQIKYSKRSDSIKTRKTSQKKKAISIRNQTLLKQEMKQKIRSSFSPDIIRESANSVLNQIQNKGIKCSWKEIHEDLCQKQNEEIQNDENQIWSAFSGNQSYEKSYASTMDYQQNSITQYNQANKSISYNNFNPSAQQYSYSPYMNQSSFCQNIFEIRLQAIGYDARTTIMIRNIPNKYTIKDLSQQIDYYRQNTYDFLYLPCDLKNQCNVGYGFINFIHTTHLEEFYINFHNQKWSRFRSEKICNLTYARLQGLDSLIDHFQNSKVLNQKQKKYRPIIKKNSKINNLIKTQQQK